MAVKQSKSWISKSTASKGVTTKPSRSAFTTTARSIQAASTSRPSTAASRPTTSAAKSNGLNTTVEREWVAAVIESKGVGREVGIASCDLSSGRCVLTQVRESTHAQKWGAGAEVCTASGLPNVFQDLSFPYPGKTGISSQAAIAGMADWNV